MGKLEDAMRTAQKGRRLAQEYADPLYEGYILVSMGLIAIEQKYPSTAHAYLQAALAIAYEINDKRLESRALANLGYSAGFVLQEYAEAQRFYEMAYKLYQQFGESSQECITLSNLGWVASMLGNFEAAFSYYGRALSVAREVGYAYLETNTLNNLSAVSAIVGNTNASLAYSQDALVLSRKTGDRSGEAWALLYMGYAFLLNHQLSQAEEAFRQSALIREELGQPLLKNEPQAGLLQTFLAMEKPEAALVEAEAILPYLQKGDALQGTEEPLRVYYACYLVLEKMNDPRRDNILRSAMHLLEMQVSKLPDDNAREMFVEKVPWRRSIRKVADELKKR
jgi:tetratricopeptide (TPR) repeat protein